MPITPHEALQRTIEHREIFHDEMIELMRQIMRGEVSPVMTAAILTGLRVKKETVGEIAGAASVMRELAEKVTLPPDPHMLDIVGTGGDGAHSFNISTTSMFVAAAAGAHVAKHGNRGVSSASGSADVLEALGAKIDLGPERVARCIAECGIGFMFAPRFHPAMKAVAPVRHEMGVRTLFNILGPLTNPAGAPNILMGVFHPDLVGIQVRVLERLGVSRALVVHGKDGLDEISLGGATLVGELRGGKVREYEIEPEQFDIPMASSRNLRVADATESKTMLLQVLDGAEGVARNIVVLNAGAALYASGVADSIEDGIASARRVLDDGSARAKLDRFVRTTQTLADAEPRPA
ncbi:MAG TPA: anthranilate phosphoribosyltransferase [Rhodanobacteraceae bacterium]